MREARVPLAGPPGWDNDDYVDDFMDQERFDRLPYDEWGEFILGDAEGAPSRAQRSASMALIIWQAARVFSEGVNADAC